MKVLVVEDEMLERKAMVHLIRDGFPQVSEILTAENGGMAVEIAIKERPELILMDINLPLLDGVAAAAKIREQWQEAQIIMVSAYSDYEHLRGSIRNQVLDYIVKPYSAESVQEVVAQALRGRTDETMLYGKAGTIQKVKNYIESHYVDNISLKDVADEVGLEKSYLGRLFREACGVTVMGYLREVRILRAKELLICGMPPGEVAVKTGFGDPAYFAKSFKQAVGSSPARYKECFDTAENKDAKMR